MLGLGERPSITRSSKLNRAPPFAVLCRCCLTAHPPSFKDHLLWLCSLQGGTGATFLVLAVLRRRGYLLAPFIHPHEIDRMWLAQDGWAFHPWSRLLWPGESGSQSKQGNGLSRKVYTAGTEKRERERKPTGRLWWSSYLMSHCVQDALVNSRKESGIL